MTITDHLFLIIVTYAAVDISPVNPLVKAGEEITLMCRSSKPLEAEDCVWTLNGVALRVRDASRYTRSGVLERGECGIKVKGLFSEVVVQSSLSY